MSYSLNSFTGLFRGLLYKGRIIGVVQGGYYRSLDYSLSDMGLGARIQGVGFRAPRFGIRFQGCLG